LQVARNLCISWPEWRRENDHHPDAVGDDQTNIRVRQRAANKSAHGQPGALGIGGHLVEIPHAYPELTVSENLEVARRLHPGTQPGAVDQVIERLGLAAYADRRAGTLSQGNAQRLGLAKALLHRPRLLILDEPANGLDPAGIVEIREMLLELTPEGVTVFMASHILAEVSRLPGAWDHPRGRLLQELASMSWSETGVSGLLGAHRRARLALTTAAPCRILRTDHRAQEPAILIGRMILPACCPGRPRPPSLWNRRISNVFPAWWV
jgi:hypothetical protein